MNDRAETPFQYNPRLDAEYIGSLFGDDFSSVKEIFVSFLSDTADGYQDVKEAFLQGDLQLLRQKIHKIKPTFGFVGLTQLTHDCETVIRACDSAGSMAEVEDACKDLFLKIEDSFVLIQQEVDRLNDYGA